MWGEFSDLQTHFYWGIGQDEFHITFFRSRFIKEDVSYSIIPVIKKIYFEDRAKFTKYTFFKFKELTDYIDKSIE